MGFLDGIFVKKDSDNHNLWNKIENIEDLELVIEKSFQHKVLIFKHSTRCFISKTVLNSFEKQIENSDKDYSYYFLDLIKYRGVSNEIENRFGVVHQSPQVIGINNGTVFCDFSHQDINLDTI